MSKNIIISVVVFLILRYFFSNSKQIAAELHKQMPANNGIVPVDGGVSQEPVYVKEDIVPAEIEPELKSYNTIYNKLLRQGKSNRIPNLITMSDYAKPMPLELINATKPIRTSSRVKYPEGEIGKQLSTINQQLNLN